MIKLMGIAVCEQVCMTLNENPLAGTLHPLSHQGFSRLLLNPKIGTTSFLHPTEEPGQTGMGRRREGFAPISLKSRAAKTITELWAL